jgi:hypothetical protein
VAGSKNRCRRRRMSKTEMSSLASTHNARRTESKFSLIQTLAAVDQCLQYGVYRVKASIALPQGAHLTVEIELRPLGRGFGTSGKESSMATSISAFDSRHRKDETTEKGRHDEKVRSPFLAFRLRSPRESTCLSSWNCSGQHACRSETSRRSVRVAAGRPPHFPDFSVQIHGKQLGSVPQLVIGLADFLLIFLSHGGSLL